MKKFLKSESKFSEPKSKSVFIESVFYIFVFDFGTTSVYRKITIRYISIQNSNGVISINIKLYRFYSVIVKNRYETGMYIEIEPFFTVSLHEIDLKPILWNPYSIPVPKINRYETDMYIGFKPNYYIKPVKKRYMNVKSVTKPLFHSFHVFSI